MSMSIFDSFLKVESCDYYCKEVAKKLGMEVFSYYWDNHTQTQISSDNHISTWTFNVPGWQRTFQLNKPKTIKKMGLENYVAEKKQLDFHLTVRGYSILYVVKFHVPVRKNETEASVNNNDVAIEYSQEENGQLSFIF